MRVAIVVWKLFPSFVGGTERQSRLLAFALAKLGVQVDVICAEVPPGDDPSTLPFRILPIGWTRWLPNLVAEFIFCVRAARLINRGTYDVVYGQNLALWQYVGDKRAPCVMNPHGLEHCKPEGWWPRWRGWPRRRALRSTAQRADAVVSLGGRLTAEVPRVLGVDPDRVVEVPPGVDLALMDRLRASTGSVSKLPQSLLCVARLESNKGVDLLIEAMGMLAGHPEAHLYVIGAGSRYSRLSRTAPRNVTLLGHQSDEELIRWYQRVEALILPSRNEGFGVVILEAMAFGLPIIATDTGATATAVSEENGRLVRPGNAAVLAGAIDELLSFGPEKKASLGARSREIVSARFAWDTIGLRNLEVLERVAGGWSRAPTASENTSRGLRMLSSAEPPA